MDSENNRTTIKEQVESSPEAIKVIDNYIAAEQADSDRIDQELDESIAEHEFGANNKDIFDDLFWDDEEVFMNEETTSN